MRTFLALGLVLLDVSPWRRPPPIIGYVIAVHGEAVVRFDRDGKKLWEHACKPYDARDLGWGRVLVTERDGRVFIVDRDGKQTWSAGGLIGPVDAERLPDGHTLVLENGANRVVELDADGKRVWEAGGLENPFDADRLPDGHTLVADSGHNRLVELDREGKV